MRFPISFGKYGDLFNVYDDKGKGRLCMISSAILTSLVGTLSGGLFYTTFLVMNGINLVNIGIITFIPYIANCFSIFSPSILERFPKRRWLLAASRFCYYTLNIVGITLLPNFVHDESLKIVLFVVILFTANIVNALFSSGYSVWHVNFLPNEIRADYFSVSSIVVTLFTYAAALICSLVADSMTASANQAVFILAMRYGAYAVALLDLFVLTRPKEYPYARSVEKVRFTDIFVKPFHEKRFLATVGIVCGYMLASNLTAASINYYLLEDVGIPYSMIWTINLTYTVFLIALQPLVRKFIRRIGWFKTFGIGLLLGVPFWLMHGFVNAQNYLWLFLIVRISQHVCGVFQNMTYANMPYINLPPADQTNFMSFYTLASNCAAFLGMMVGTWFIALTGNTSGITLFGVHLGSVQMLLCIEGIAFLALALTVLLRARSLTPAEQ